MKKAILVTGEAAFYGAAVCKRLLADGEIMIGIGNINDYYNHVLKISRPMMIEPGRWQFEKLDISDESSVENLFKKHKPYRIIHFGAQAGICYSSENPRAYVQSNLLEFGNILEW